MSETHKSQAEVHQHPSVPKKPPLEAFSPKLQYPIAAGTVATPTRVLYLRVIYATNSTYDPSLVSYGAKSGTYDLTGSNITSFISQVQSGTITAPQINTTPNGSSDPLTPVIDYPCYIVYHVAKNGFAQFRKEMDAASTDDADTAPEYVNLVHVLDDGTTIPGSNLQPNVPSNTSSSPCHILYFQTAACPSTQGQDLQPDGFNLYVYVKQANNAYKAGAIDPDIKNIGH
jgi:hypothetical protein